VGGLKRGRAEPVQVPTNGNTPLFTSSKTQNPIMGDLVWGLYGNFGNIKGRNY